MSFPERGSKSGNHAFTMLCKSLSLEGPIITLLQRAPIELPPIIIWQKRKETNKEETEHTINNRGIIWVDLEHPIVNICAI